MRGKRVSKNLAYKSKTVDEIRNLARDLRKRLGIDTQYAPDLWLVLRRFGELYPGFKLKTVADSDFPHIEAKAYGRAFMMKLRESFETALKYYGDARARFTVAHELGHLLLGHPGNQPRIRADNKNNSQLIEPELEREANIFASEFLMPSDLVDPSMSADEISRLFKVSLDTALRRESEIRDKSKTQKPTAPIPANSSQGALAKKGHRTPEILPIVFVSMAYTYEMNRLYTEIFKPTIKSLGFTSLRADEIASAESVPADIRRAVESCTLVIAEISEFNPNVMHEIGLAQSIDKPTIIVCRSGYGEDQIPSNIRHIRRIMYPNDAGGGPILQRQLEEILGLLSKCL